MNNKGLHFETNLVMNPVKGVSLFQKQKNNAYVVIFTNFHVSKMQKKKKKKKKKRKMELFCLMTTWKTVIFQS